MRTECNRHVQVYFSPEEKAELANQLARNTQDLETLTDRKKQVASEFKAKIDAATAEIFKVARLLGNGYEYRDVKCDVQFDTPRPGVKRVVRMDTGEVVDETPMSADELQQALDFGIEKAVESAAEEVQPEAQPGPEPQPEAQAAPKPDPTQEPEAAPPAPAELPAPISEPVRAIGTGNGWSAEIIILETAAGFEAEVSFQLGAKDPVVVDGGSPFGSESEAREDAAARLHRLAQKHYAEAHGPQKRVIRDLMSWAAERMGRPNAQ